MVEKYFTKQSSNIHIDYLIQKFNCFVDEYNGYENKDNYAYLISLTDSNDVRSSELHTIMSKKDMDMLYKRVKEESIDKIDGAISNHISAVIQGMSIFNSIFDICKIDVNSQLVIRKLIDPNSSKKLKKLIEQIFNIKLS